MKKIFALLLAATLAVGTLASCGTTTVDDENNQNEVVENAGDENKEENKEEEKNALEDIKIGFIFLHDENSTYDKNFIDAAKAAQKALGLKDDQVIFKVNVPESNDCYEAAADMADEIGRASCRERV